MKSLQNRPSPTTGPDAETPGGVYLCQVSETVSCGACCGIYNVADASREALTEMLTWRTRAFADAPRTPDGITAFKEAVEHREPQARPYPQFHHCPYIGLIGEDHSRVGCLLHPMASGNNGVDFRGLSFYGGLACRTYFCPTHRALSPEVKRIIRAAADDWQGFGLIVTEHALLSAFFAAVEATTGEPVDAAAFLASEERVQAVRGLIRLKIEWPFRAEPGKFCNYFFEDGLYPRPSVDYTACGGVASRFDAVFRGLDSAFRSADELCAAETLVEALVGRCAS